MDHCSGRGGCTLAGVLGEWQQRVAQCEVTYKGHAFLGGVVALEEVCPAGDQGLGWRLETWRCSG